MAPLYNATTNNTFLLSTDTLTFDLAEASCNLVGAHLASYISRCAARWPRHCGPLHQAVVALHAWTLRPAGGCLTLELSSLPSAMC